MEEAQAAIDAQDGKMVEGRMLAVQFTKPRPARQESRDFRDSRDSRGSRDSRDSRDGRRRGPRDYRDGPAPGQSDPSTTLMVRNLPLDATSSSLVEYFQGCTKARVVTDRETGRARG